MRILCASLASLLWLGMGQQIVDKSVSPRRFTVLLLGAFAVFALVLASLGIYALISYSVNQRTQEIGIRMAIGATGRDIQRQIVGQTLRLTAIGAAIGTAASWTLARNVGSVSMRPIRASTTVGSCHSQPGWFSSDPRW